MSIARLGRRFTEEHIRETVRENSTINVQLDGVSTVRLKAAESVRQDVSRFKKSDSFEQLTEFIPTETITLFVAAVGARELWIQEYPQAQFLTNSWILVGIFALLTPLMLWLTAFANYRQEQKVGQLSMAVNFRPPWFYMVGAMISFTVWSCAVPGLYESPLVQVSAAVASLFVSWLFSQLSRIFV